MTRAIIKQAKNGNIRSFELIVSRMDELKLSKSMNNGFEFPSPFEHPELAKDVEELVEEMYRIGVRWNGANYGAIERKPILIIEVNLMISIAGLALAISGIAVVVSSISAYIARKSIVAPLVVKLLNEYSSESFLDAMLELREFEKTSNEEGNKFDDVYKKEWDGRTEQGCKIHKARRKIAHHFHLIARLKDMNILSKKDVMEIISKDQISFLIEIVKPLEGKLNARVDNHLTYKLFNEYFQEMSEKEKDWRENMMW